MLSVELQSVQKNIKARDNRSKYCFKSARHLLLTSTETAGLKTVAVFITLGSSPCEFLGSTAALGACWEAQEGFWCLRPSSWGAGSQCPPGSQSGPVRSAGFVVPPTGPHSRSLPVLRRWWSNTAGRTSWRGSSLVYLCFVPAEFAGRTDGGCKVTDTSGGTGTNSKHPSGKRKKNTCCSQC